MVTHLFKLETNTTQSFSPLGTDFIRAAHPSETSDFLCVLPHYDRPSQSPAEVIDDDGLGNAFVLMMAGRYARLNHNNKSQSFPGPSLQITVT